MAKRRSAGADQFAGSRNFSDFSVTDVLVELSDPGPLLVGMKVDVYFQNEVATQ